MPGLSALVVLVSLDVVTKLVAAGYGLPALTVTAASNTSPIVLTTAQPHNVRPGQTIHGVVAGVGGNLAANGTWVLAAVDASNLSLSTVAGDGTASPVAGSGVYTSGGTIQTAFVDGKMLLGRQHIAEQSAAPRVVWVPMASQFGPRSMTNPSQVAGAPSNEMRTQWSTRSVVTDRTQFEVHVWGQAPTPDPDLDFDATRALYQQVIASTHLLTTGRYVVGNGTWSDQKPTAAQIVKAGHEFVFGLSFETPVLDQPLPFVPSGTKGVSSVYLQPADGSPPELGFQG